MPRELLSLNQRALRAFRQGGTEGVLEGLRLLRQQKRRMRHFVFLMRRSKDPTQEVLAAHWPWLEKYLVAMAKDGYQTSEIVDFLLREYQEEHSSNRRFSLALSMMESVYPFLPPEEAKRLEPYLGDRARQVNTQ